MKFIANPHHPFRLGDFLLEGLESAAVRFDGASAFARRSGVSYLAPAIHSFSETRPFRLTVGIDLLGTSKEAIELLLASAGSKAELFVFHNPAAAFHPKVYRFEQGDRWETYSGSGNLTKGGLFQNYEIGLCGVFDKGNASDEAANQSVDSEFARWTDVTMGSVKPLTGELIKELVDRRLVLNETTIGATRSAARAAAGKPKKKGPFFESMEVPAAPAIPTKSTTFAEDSQELGEQPQAGAAAVVAIRQGNPTTFVMTVRKTDVGVGQTTPGTQKRAAEVFIPLPCVWEQPVFWGWPGRFEADAAWTGPVKHGFGKMDRRQMPFYLESHALWVTMTFNPDKGDFRLRNSELRDAGQIDDILKISISGTSQTPVYVAEYVRVGTAEHAVELARCTTSVKKPSTKLYGYY